MSSRNDISFERGSLSPYPLPLTASEISPPKRFSIADRVLEYTKTHWPGDDNTSAVTAMQSGDPELWLMEDFLSLAKK